MTAVFIGHTLNAGLGCFLYFSIFWLSFNSAFLFHIEI